MKYILGIVLLFCSMGNLFSQENHYFAPDKTKWYQSFYCSTQAWPGGGSQYYQKRIYAIDGETTINGKIYQKLFTSNTPYTCSFGSHVYGSCGSINSISYDENNLKFLTYLYWEAGKLYYGKPDSLTMLYNFNLALNEQFNSQTVVQIDSVTIGNTLRKRITFSDGIKWVEGVGDPEHGLSIVQLPNCRGPIPKETLTSLVLPPSTSAMEEITLKSNDIEIYPNPTQGKVFINSLTNERILKISISNLEGKELGLKLMKEQNCIDLSSLDKGIYIIGIQTLQGRKFFKVIKN